ncbi:hypothetical protein NGF75_13335 [Dietzia kunjamensis]|uniref:hypothetical protein n=1 Tax=Dietzia kunjamensis TaxID=322509 RepID=UPI002DB87364|nr:hypothetical protein [Dietzia kunjamensis]MEB8326955.1 hypothetical protein [Dietzia kunjamensis]
MPAGAERPLERALDETIVFVKDALKRAAPIQGVIDLPPFDERAANLSHEKRRAIVLGQLPTPIPLPARGEPKRARKTPARRPPWGRRISLWALFILAVAFFALPAVSIAFALTWLVVLVWTSKSADEELADPPGVNAVGDGTATDLETRIIWMARWQVAAILGTRAWESEDLAGTGRIDLSHVLDSLTERALSLLRFTSTSQPMPSRTQPELRRQWEREQARIESIRAELIEKVAALIIYREHLDLISDLLDQRDQIAVFSERAAAFDQALPPTSEGQALLEATAEQGDLRNNLASQIRYLSELAEGTASSLPLRGSPPGR